MGSIQNFVVNMDWWGLLGLVVSVAATLLCFTVHELCHGAVAYRLWDPTAKLCGRLTLNPIRHIDVAGLIMMLVARVGWAKPVPVDMRNFKNPKRGMALTALAGPASNFLMALAALALSSLIFHFAPFHPVWLVVLCFLCNVALLSVGMGLFNLIPISPLDGSKIFFSFLPDKLYYTILKYERFVMIAVILLTFLGVFRRPLSFLIVWVLRGLCVITGFPLDGVLLYQDVSYIMYLFGVS